MGERKSARTFEALAMCRALSPEDRVHSSSAKAPINCWSRSYSTETRPQYCRLWVDRNSRAGRAPVAGNPEDRGMGQLKQQLSHTARPPKQVREGFLNESREPLRWILCKYGRRARRRDRNSRQRDETDRKRNGSVTSSSTAQASSGRVSERR